MSRQGVERRLREQRLEGEYLFPAYDDYCFANVPETTLSVLDGSFDRLLPGSVLDGVATDVDYVVLVLLDGFGYESWTREFPHHELLAQLEDRGTVTPLTSIYPSETAAAITTLHTGLEPVEHGLLGWYQYLESVRRDVVTLPFLALSGEPLGEVAPNADARDLFAGESLYERATAAGIDVQVIQPAAYADSGYTQAVTAGAERTGYETAADLALAIRRTLEDASGPTYVNAYVPTLDEIAHTEGTTTERYRANLASITACLRRELLERLDPAVAERTLFVLTADHGIVDTVPAENVDVTAWDDWPTLREAFRRDDDGEPRRPTGSPRNVHLHVRPDRLEEARTIVESAVGQDVRVFTRGEALERGLFGTGDPSELFERRCGDLIVVHRNRGLCWRSGDSELVGMHGGLTPEEMLVPLAAVRLDDLAD